MGTCPSCGKEVMENFDTCFHCGEGLTRNLKVKSLSYKRLSDQVFLWYVLALFFPIIGVIIALSIRREDKELASRILLVVYISFVFYAIMVAIPALFLLV